VEQRADRRLIALAEIGRERAIRLLRGFLLVDRSSAADDERRPARMAIAVTAITNRRMTWCSGSRPLAYLS
jgi:hypothetical protein